MRARMHTAAKTFLAVAALVFCAGADQKAYTIKLDRPAVRGDKHHIEMVTASLVTWKTSWDEANPVVTEQASGARLDADAEVRSVGKTGNIGEMALKVRHCTLNEGKNDSELVAAGAEIVARADRERTLFTIDGKKAERRVQEGLESLMRLESPDETDAFDTFMGASGPVHVGDSWPINAKMCVEHYEKRGWTVARKDISGHIKLVGLETCNGEPCLKLELDMTIKQFRPPSTSTTKPEQTISDSSMTEHEVWLVPENPAKEVQSRIMSRTVIYKFEGSREGRAYSCTRTEAVEQQSHLVPAEDSAP